MSTRTRNLPPRVVAAASVATPSRSSVSNGTLFELFVPGASQPAGSKKAVPVWSHRTGTFAVDERGRPIISVMDDAKYSRAWKSHITALAAMRWRGPPIDEALELSLLFVMRRPQNHYRTKSGTPYLRPNAPHFHTGAPDSTKLTRAVEDALNKLVWKDDSRVAKQSVVKIYGDAPGCLIRVRRANRDHGFDTWSNPQTT